MDAADQWSAQKTVPSIVFVLAPSIAVGMLVIWSIRMQRARRAWYLELMQRQRAGVATGSGSGINPLDKPGMHAVWLETSWDEKHHSTEEEKEEEDVGSGHDRGKRRKSSSSYQSYVTERYSWQTILPVSLAEPAKKDGLSDVSVMIRMPISNGSTNDSNLHKDVTDNELQIATLRLRPPLLPAPSGSTAAA